MERPVDWLPAINDDTVDCPPFSVVMAVSVDPFGNIHFTRYDGSASPILFFSGQGVIPAVSSVPGAVGVVTRTFPATAGYSGPDPSPGDTWGAVEDVWQLQPGVPGYTILGGAGLGAVNVVEQVTDNTEPQSVLKARVTVTSLGAAYTRTGNTIVADANGALGTLDGVTMVVGNRVLLRSGNSSAGIYTIQGLGDGSSKFVLTRSSDADTSAELPSGTLITVSEGTTSADTLWMLTTNDPITLNTTSLVFTQIAPGITSINGQTGAAQTLAVGTAGTDFAIATTTDTNTFNLPDASTTARGAVTTGVQTIAGGKTLDVGSVAGTPPVLTLKNTITTAYLSLVSSGAVEQLTIGRSNTGGTIETLFGGLVVYGGSAIGVSPYSAFGRGLVPETSYLATAISSSGSATLVTIHLDEDNNRIVLSAYNGSYVAPTYSIKIGSTIYDGASGTSGGGDTVSGGIITALGSGAVITIGNPVSGGTANYILFVDASGNLAQSSDFQWDDTAKTLTLGTSGYLIGSKVGTPTLGTNGTVAGPYIKDF